MTTNKQMLFVVLLAQIAAVGALDYYTGYEVRVGALYAVPVAFAAWHFGILLGTTIGVTVAGVELWAELAAGKIYSAQWILYANTVSRLSIFLFVAFSFYYFRRTIEIAKKRVQAFKGRLPVCVCCYRVDGGDGFWMDFPTYLRKNSEAELEFRNCPLCEKTGKKPIVGEMDSQDGLRR